MEDLIANINASHIILSYNTEGIISEEDLTLLLQRYSFNNQIDVKRIPYRKYQSKKNLRTKTYTNFFFIFKESR